MFTITLVTVNRSAFSLAGYQKSVSSSLCVAQFRAGAVRTAVSTFVLMQDGHTSVLFSGVLQTAIATVSSRPYGDSRGFFSFYSLHFALMRHGPHS
jgi:hypothetical protein